MNEEVKKLRPWEEITDILQNIEIENDKNIMVLNFIHRSIEIPFNQYLVKEIESHIGQKISLLRTDLENKPYLLMKGGD